MLPCQLLRGGRQSFSSCSIPEQSEEFPVVGGRCHRPVQGGQLSGRPTGLGLTACRLGEGLLPGAVQLGPAPGPTGLPGFLPQILGTAIGAAGTPPHGTIAPAPIESNREPTPRQFLFRIDQMDPRQQSLNLLVPGAGNGLQHLPNASFDGFPGDSQDIVGIDPLVAHPGIQQPRRSKRSLDGGHFMSR